jgi:hypothetical protein
MTVLERVLPQKFLLYRYRGPVPYDPLVPCPRPFTQNAWNVASQAPTEVGIAAAALDGAGTRGLVEFQAPWGEKTGFLAIQIAGWKSTDPTPATYADTLINARAGRCGFAAPPGMTSHQAAAAMGAAMVQMLRTAGVLESIGKLGALVSANMPGQPNGSLVVVVPRPWIQPQQTNATGAFLAMQFGNGHPGTYRPIMMAGLRPAPQMVTGAEWQGFAGATGPSRPA